MKIFEKGILVQTVHSDYYSKNSPAGRLGVLLKFIGEPSPITGLKGRRLWQVWWQGTDDVCLVDERYIKNMFHTSIRDCKF